MANSLDVVPFASILTAIIAVVSSGSYGVLMRAPPVIINDPDPVIFHLYSSVSFAIPAALLALVKFDELTVSWYTGAISALIWLATQTFTFVGISLLGYSVAMPMIGGLGVLCAFVGRRMIEMHDRRRDPTAPPQWGGDQPHSGDLAPLFAMAAIILGITAISIAREPAVEVVVNRIRDRRRRWSRSTAPASTPHSSNYGTMSPAAGTRTAASTSERHPPDDVHAPLLSGCAEPPTVENDLADPQIPPAFLVDKRLDHLSHRARHLAGISSTIVAGLLTGVLWIQYWVYRIPRDGGRIKSHRPSNFLFSMCSGIAVMTPCLLLTNLCIAARRSPLPRHLLSDVSLPAIITGLLWIAGFWCTALTIDDLPQPWGEIVPQWGIVVAALWGSIYYEELLGLEEESGSVLVFVVGITLVLGGGLLLGWTAVL